MSKTVFELAKELNIQHTDLVAICKKLRIRNVSGVMAELDERSIQKVMKSPALKAALSAAEKPKAKAPKAEASAAAVEPTPSVDTEAPAAQEPKAEPAPEPSKPAPEPVQAEASTEPAEPSPEPSPEATAEPSAEPAESASAPQGDSPAAAEEKPARPAAKKEVYVARPATSSASAGGAKQEGQMQATITGRKISLDQLRERTARPARGPRGDRPRGGRGRYEDRSVSGRPAGGGGPGAGGFNPESIPLPADPLKEQQRRRTKVVREEVNTSDRPRSARTARRRQEFDQSDLYRGNGRKQSRVRRKVKSRKSSKLIITTPAAHKRVVRVDETISVGELAKTLGVKAQEVIKKLMDLGVMANINQRLDFDTVTVIANEYNFEAKNVAFDESELLSGPAVTEEAEADPDAILRAPVVTVMGHVDHGKTTLIDRIRSANVASGEAGGITQHIGAYKVETKSGPVVFLDTPGHAAFSSMRARGASVTDLIVLVVAADDGVMPQTVESIKHAQAANVPIVVAVNKCDKHGVDPNKIRQEMTQFELVPEEWGGDTMYVNISALNGDGVDELLDSLALQAEVLELKANPKKQAYGRVVEARVDRGRGTVVTVLVQEGTLKQGDFMVVGQSYGRVRSMTSHMGKKLKSAGPSTPVEISGLNGVPAAGEEFTLVKNERDAKRVVSNRESKAREANKPASILPSDPWNTVEAKVQTLILKADVAGSLEAVKHSLEALSTEEVEVKIITSAVGQITESDVYLAQTANASIIGFNAGPDSKAKRLAEQAGVSIERYSIIYELIDAVKDLMSGLLEPEIIETRLGKAEVRAVFHIQKVGSIAGSFVLDGKVLRNASGRVLREGEQLHEGKIHTLKRFKDDVREVSTGYECGIAIEGYKDVRMGDMIEVIEYQTIRRTIDG